MKRQTRTILLNVATGIAIAATATMMLLPSTVSAQDEPSIGFGFGVGPNGPNVQFGVNNDNNERRRGRPQRQSDAEVCFFENSRLRGESFCIEEGASVRNLRDWADEISSFDNPDGLEVTVCSRTNFRGSCRTYTSSARSLGSLDDNVESIRVEN